MTRYIIFIGAIVVAAIIITARVLMGKENIGDYM